jgi:anti-anti-sigma regulatory factor
MALDIQKNNWQVSEALTFKTIADIEKQSLIARKQLETKQTWVINCENLIHMDSAGLAWIMTNFAFAKKHNISIHLQNLMLENVLLLAEVQGISQILQGKASQNG